MIYKLYEANEEDRKIFTRAISEKALESDKPEDFFLAYTDIRLIGQIEVSGDTHFLDEYFDVS